MLISVELNKDYCEVIFHRSVSLISIFEGVERIRELFPKVDQLRSLLVNFSQTSNFELSYLQLVRLAEYKWVFAALNKEFRLAIVAPTDIIFGSARVWESYMNDPDLDIGLFRNLLMAQEWLKRAAVVH